MSIISTILGAESYGGRNVGQGLGTADVNNNYGAGGGTPAQGYFQIIDPTWNSYGGGSTGYASAIQAPYATQLGVAQNIPVNQWGPATQTALQNAGYAPQPGETLGSMLTRYGESPTGTVPADGSSPFGATTGGDGSNIAANGNTPYVASPYAYTMDPAMMDEPGNFAPQGFGSANQSGVYNLGATPGTISGDINSIGTPSAADFAAAPTVNMPNGTGAGYTNPAQPMASVPGTTSSTTYAGLLSGPWEAMGVTATSQGDSQIASAAQAAGATQAAATTSAAQLAAAQSAATTGTWTAAITDWFVRGGVLFLGLVFLAGGVFWFTRQEA